MLSTTLSLAVAVSYSLHPPWIVTNKGTIHIETPSGDVITVPENSIFLVNRASVRFDLNEITLDNVEIFRDGFE